MRYLGLTEADRREMLAVIGAPNIDALFRDVPAGALNPQLDLPPHQGELEVERAFAAMAKKNVSPMDVPFFLGAGAYRHHIPAAVDHLIQRSEFLTSYTPYQPEISQGTLQYLFEFQTQVSMITGMEVANASMYDGATAAAEAVLMAQRVTKKGKAVLSGGLHPHYRDTIATLMDQTDQPHVAAPTDLNGSEDLSALIDDQTACVVVQNPSVFGHLRDLSGLAKACQAKDALLVVAVAEVTSLGLVTPPGAMGADIVVAEGQGLGVPLSFGGPYVGLFATREKFVRQMPGRLCGETVDQDGRRGFVLTLSAREQHIRREKATSNICTNSGLCALAFTIHLSLLGEAGFTRLAEINHAKAVQLAEKVATLKGVEVIPDAFYNEFAVKLPKPAADVVEALVQKNILGGVPAARLFPGEPALHDVLLLAATETNSEGDMDALVAALKEVL
ncbi:MAG TPA: aminomethyl-transferring glycine dehydrogenase subunit GcvPA [Ferrovibrio sp.]|uniref:aminomethyl-transferring glycine dehydrogenase subunit GcvPA n=1 Tax=Ferrovibrio sp. TaxID=1917215 RepID=UPI002B4B7988|nr:aminomethyl-transferring glycine dehydrogenase subunit GcvPA [Ferrovibrio sp.]HLT78814.1 aminomethyl-transferring glycine dehydrogenase subunit GcvPA [Ferrovibrio sp.]